MLPGMTRAPLFAIQTFALASLVLAPFACGRPPAEPLEPAEPAAKVEPTPEEPAPEPAPEPAAPDPAQLEAARSEAAKQARIACGVPDSPDSPDMPDMAFAEARKFKGGEHAATYRFEGEAFTTDLELEVDDTGAIELRHPKRKALTGGGLSTCSQFYEGDAVHAQIVDHGPLDSGARLLEVWISCGMGEDIRSVDSEVWLVADDGKTLERVWSTSAAYQGSFVCAQFDVLAIDRVGSEVVVTRTWVAEIYEPTELPAYDCEGAREVVESRGCERVSLVE